MSVQGVSVCTHTDVCLTLTNHLCICLCRLKFKVAIMTLVLWNFLQHWTLFFGFSHVQGQIWTCMSHTSYPVLGNLVTACFLWLCLGKQNQLISSGGRGKESSGLGKRLWISWVGPMGEVILWQPIVIIGMSWNHAHKLGQLITESCVFALYNVQNGNIVSRFLFCPLSVSHLVMWGVIYKQDNQVLLFPYRCGWGCSVKIIILYTADHFVLMNEWFDCVCESSVHRQRAAPT